MIADWHIPELIKLVRHRYPNWDGFDHPPFMEEELDYKYATIAKAKELLSKGETKRLLEQGDYEGFIERLVKIGRDNNLLWTAQPRRGDLAILHTPHLPKWEFCEQMRALLYDRRPSPDKLLQFANYCEANNLPNKWPFPTYFLFITRPHAEMFIKPTVAKWFMQFMGMAELYTTTPHADMYERYKKNCHGLLAELASYGATDMVHIQSFIWVAHRESKNVTGGLTLEGQIELDKPDDEWEADEEEAAMVYEQIETEALPVLEAAAVYQPAAVAEYTLAQLAQDSGYSITQCQQWVDAIGRKKQAVLYGPPGTGKTYLAQKLAQHLVGGGDGFIELVQFHPAYDYTDFMEGIRPQSADGRLNYQLQPGRFLAFCEQARGRKETCVLIIDELNRANISRVFGELMYLLEYRDQQIPLASGTTFTIPDNVRLIATMNTADRSIALVDHALRRRFAFIPLWPNMELLRHYHQHTGLNVEPLIQLLEQLNRHIDNPHYALGVSFFMRPDLQTSLAAIWQFEIEPYLEEYFFSQPSRVTEYRWTKIAERLRPLTDTP